MVSLNDEIDQETAVLVSEEFGFQVNYQAEQSLKQEEIEYPKPNLNFQMMINQQKGILLLQ